MTTPETNPDRQRKLAERVEKLLMLAADTRTPDEERQAAYAKAADLMTRHNIDQAMVRRSSGQAPETVGVYRFEVTNSGTHGKARTFAAGSIAEALGCKCAYSYAGRGRRTCYVTIIGMASDIATVRTLLPLVMAQAEHAAGPAARTHGDAVRQRLIREWYPGDQIDNAVRRERATFYRSFIQAYGDAVATRIRQRRQAMVAEAVSSGTGAELVLVDRDQRVTAAFVHRYPKLRTARTSQHSPEGLAAGHEAGRRADLGDGRLTSGDRTALPSA